MFVTDIYAAGETPIEGVDSQSLVTEIEYSGSMEETYSKVMKEFSSGDLVICLGAGSITRLAGDLAKASDDICRTEVSSGKKSKNV